VIKGKNQHVMPDSSGWCVIDEANLMVIQHFDNREQAMAYAQQCAECAEGEVLVHATGCEPSELSTVSLPQREFIPGKGYTNLSSAEAKKEEGAFYRDMKKSDYDPLLGYDEYYFDI